MGGGEGWFVVVAFVTYSLLPLSLSLSLSLLDQDLHPYSLVQQLNIWAFIDPFCD